MIIEINSDIVKEFFSHFSREAVFFDFNNNEVKRLIVSEFTSNLYLDSFTTPTFKGCSRRLLFKLVPLSLKIEKLGVLTASYRLCGEE